MAAAAILGCAGIGACAMAPPPAPALRVELRVTSTLTDTPASFVIPADTLAAVSGIGTANSTTLASSPAADAVAELRQALDSEVLPAVSSPLTLTLPTDSVPDPTEWDIVLFVDTDRDGRWSRGESFVTAWTGGTGSHRVAYVAAGDELPPGAVAGWNLLEGGAPRTYHPLDAVVVTLNPLQEPITR